MPGRVACHSLCLEALASCIRSSLPAGVHCESDPPGALVALAEVHGENDVVDAGHWAAMGVAIRARRCDPWRALPWTRLR